MTCPHCHAALGPDARFCPACGKQTVSTESMLGPPPPGKTQEFVGREIAGRYRILTKLGEGGMGAVFKGEQISLKRQVAVKLLKPDLSANPQLLARFKIEAEAVAKLKHPNTVDIYDFGQDTDGTLFIAMEFIEGRSLRSAIHSEAPMPPQRALHIAAQVAASLADAHAHSIVHRDLKPDNVMLQDRGRQRDIVRVLDFGIAKLRDDSRATQQAMTQAGDMLGTPQYMAPEQIKGEAIDGRTDVYALGCMLYEMLTARLPFEAATIMAMLSKHLMEGVVPPSQRRPDLPLGAELDRLVLTAMMKQPQARPPTMEAYGEQLAAVLAQLPPDPNRSASMPLSAAQPVITPPAHSAYVPSPTPPGPQSYGQPPAVAAVPVQSQFPPSQLPTLARTSGPARRSKAPLWIAVALVVLGGGGAAAYFLTRESEPVASQPEPRHDDSPRVHDKKADPWSGSGQRDPWR
ncbi:MAG: protein kinase domain-containing protein [Acidobacteriota bacterium]